MDCRFSRARWLAAASAVLLVVPLAYLAFRQFSAAQVPPKPAANNLIVRDLKCGLAGGPQAGPVEQDEYGERAAARRTLAWVYLWMSALGTTLLAVIARLGRDLRKCRAQLRRLEEELASRGSSLPRSWPSGISLERRV